MKGVFAFYQSDFDRFALLPKADRIRNGKCDGLLRIVHRDPQFMAVLQSGHVGAEYVFPCLWNIDHILGFVAASDVELHTIGETFHRSKTAYRAAMSDGGNGDLAIGRTNNVLIGGLDLGVVDFLFALGFIRFSQFFAQGAKSNGGGGE